MAARGDASITVYRSGIERFAYAQSGARL